ncbi:MAG: hypothetical protein Salg2KO_02210 [Salibacteraceae bacterium]
MRRLILFLFSLLIGYGSVTAQDWSPARVDQELTYLMSNGSYLSIKVDSIDALSGRNLIWRKALKQDAGECDSIMLFGLYVNSDSRNQLPFYDFTIDSVIRINCSHYPNSNIQISIQSSVGKIKHLNEHYRIRLDSIVYRPVINTNDHVRYYSLLTPDSTETQLSIVLSRSFGFLSIPDFKSLLGEFESGFDYPILSLIGFKDSAQNVGLELPQA